jgi:MSHA biogenesis protein MshM
MYRAHFGLDRPPFSITPDTAFAYSSQAQVNALNTLMIATDAGEGFIKITGEVGSGKTLLCRRFLARLTAANGTARRFRTAYIPNPCLSPRTLLLAIAMELKVRVPDRDSEHSLLAGLNRALMRFAAKGEQVVVCLDEAQAMPVETLQSLRLLSNLETEQRKLIQVVLFGQRELDALLAIDALRPLRSRIAFSYRMGALSATETVSYLQHRLTIAGYRGSALIDVDAARAIHRAAHGLPRRINILAHKALLAAYGQGAESVGADHVRAACADTPAPTMAERMVALTSRLAAWLRPRRAMMTAGAGEGLQS